MYKRIIDISISLAIIIFFSPFIALILLYVFLITGDTPLFFQERKISLDKRGFKIIKIRTIKNSAQFLELDSHSSEIFIKEGYDKFVPAFCRWLRKSGLDEILQVINILKGEMSFVGPRPILVNDLLNMQKEENEYYQRRAKLNSKPGITGYWQVYGERIKGTKNLIELDERYEKEKSLLFDLKIIARTFLISAAASHSDSIIIEKQKKHAFKTRNIRLTVYKLLSIKAQIVQNN